MYAQYNEIGPLLLALSASYGIRRFEMTFNIALDRIIPLTEARSRLREIIDQTSDDRFWVLTRRGKPRVAIVDVEYLDQLIRRAWFNDLATRSQSAFDEYLRQRGLDPTTVTEEEVKELLHE
jgi:prevent-host-death family protein